MLKNVTWLAQCALLVAGGCVLLSQSAAAQDQKLTIGGVTLNAPEGWKKKQPRSRIIAYEFAATKAEGDPADGRMTAMVAGGSVKANIDRWIGQFRQPDGGDSSQKAKVEKTQVKGLTVHTVDLSGTFLDRRGPFAPPTSREDYRMLGAIIEAPQGQVFLKFYGPKKTMAKYAEQFQEMLKTMEKK